MNRQEIMAYIKSEFAISEEHLWMAFPDYIVFRNQKNKKWFAVIMDIQKSKLGFEEEGSMDILNLKCDPLLIGSLLRNKGYLPAYHMSKKCWITVLLDGSVSENELKDLIHLSYEIIDKKK